MLALLVAASPAGAQEPTAPMSRMTYSGPEGSREYTLFRPSSFPEQRSRRALVVMLHGCTQSADDFARGTRMNDAAERGGFLVLYPEQTVVAHPQKCWNWYLAEHSTRGRGEAAILAGMIDSVARAEGVAASHVSLVGMSAGAAMAANLAVAYAERYAAVAMHSGLPALAATDVIAALRVMRQGDSDGDALGIAAVSAMGANAHPIPAIVLHGAEDRVVVPANLRATVREWTVVNSRAPGAGAPVEEHLFDGVGHAWSGGSSTGSFTAPDGPDATSLVIAFFSRAGSVVAP